MCCECIQRTTHDNSEIQLECHTRHFTTNLITHLRGQTDKDLILPPGICRSASLRGDDIPEI